MTDTKALEARVAELEALRDGKITKQSRGVAEFCDDNGFSRSQLYSLWRQGKGPRRRLCGKKIIITDEDGREWLNSLPTERSE